VVAWSIPDDFDRASPSWIFVMVLIFGTATNDCASVLTDWTLYFSLAPVLSITNTLGPPGQSHPMQVGAGGNAFDVMEFWFESTSCPGLKPLPEMSVSHWA
jgi:hypothetical protein